MSPRKAGIPAAYCSPEEPRQIRSVGQPLVQTAVLERVGTIAIVAGEFGRTIGLLPGVIVSSSCPMSPSIDLIVMLARRECQDTAGFALLP